jgi:hypothetical protein
VHGGASRDGAKEAQQRDEAHFKTARKTLEQRGWQAA